MSRKYKFCEKEGVFFCTFKASELGRCIYKSSIFCNNNSIKIVAFVTQFLKLKTSYFCKLVT